MQMNIQELATAVLEELPIILCIFNNEYLGMVRQWQKLFYGKRYSHDKPARRCTDPAEQTVRRVYPEYTPDFIRLAESYGAKGIRVTRRKRSRLRLKRLRRIPKLRRSSNLSLIRRKWFTR
jgi:acetolactate synthase-1/2/3 large subunit